MSQRFFCSGEDSLELHLRDMRRFKRISKQEISEILEEYLETGDLESRDLLVLHNWRLVLWVARKFWVKIQFSQKDQGLSLSDLVQEGYIGFLRAVDRFNPDDVRKACLTTFAVNVIRSVIRRAISDKGLTIRRPAHLGDLHARIDQAKNYLEMISGHCPSAEEIAGELEIPLKTVRRELGGIDSLIPLPLLSYRLPDKSTLGPASIQEAEAQIFLSLARVAVLLEIVTKFRNFSERNRLIFEGRYGLSGQFKLVTLESIAQGLGLTRSRIDQILKKTWGKISRSPARIKTEAELIKTLRGIRELKNLLELEISLGDLPKSNIGLRALEQERILSRLGNLTQARKNGQDHFLDRSLGLDLRPDDGQEEVVVKVVCKYLCLIPREVKGGGRGSQQITQARNLGIFLLVSCFRVKESRVARFLRLSPSSVHYGYQKIRAEVQRDEEFRDFVRGLETKVRQAQVEVNG
ncbi:MAG: hypothetical protein COV31_00685 [Candidatus Yanofskybacteria bacterium CG10_big_fil_rev_8_21_14_0_10_46_23]|uniref:Chromosomal replication initiator DnaA C-terminal domain-containing protein n=1 Tax=Candidatus Yanofskybacteria bacterium CG10_big_fil_rev_8_21_14_0_10_46_23 TaxID=1975098 RepID=A0A2H0R504_9BACT|nr:MAG: hypothetical protein COV31_00685 [Candidatus Yanofskybacteria bacterium CG10_big_fil_rev_8_21_14_0_10_46_23]